MSWEIRQGKAGVYELNFTRKSREPVHISFSSDHHLDSPKCRRDLITANLEAAKSASAPVVMVGDLLDVMGCKNDPRASKHGLRPEYLKGGKDYLDAVVDDASEFLAPYAKTIALICRGNHESAIQKNNEVCVISRIVERLRMAGSQARVGGYAGWLWIRYHRSSRPENSGAIGYRVFWHHGSGAGGSGTRGIGEFSRISDYIEGADAIVCGHVHQRGIYETRRQRLTPAGNVITGSVHHVRCGCWKDEFVGDGWAVEKGIGPRPMGGWVLRLKPDHDRNGLVASWFDTL
jgi:UDP-2,3-diacylglucosamine pyrophosphatase LpxH